MDFDNHLLGGDDAGHGKARSEQVVESGSVLFAIENLRRDVNERLDNLKNEVAQIARAQSRSQADNTGAVC